MARVDIKLNSSGMRSILTSGAVRSALRAEAQKIARRAQSAAPRDTGEYASGITVVSGTTDRAVERVTATAPHSMLVESRTGNLKRAGGGR